MRPWCHFKCNICTSTKTILKTILKIIHIDKLKGSHPGGSHNRPSKHETRD